MHQKIFKAVLALGLVSQLHGMEVEGNEFANRLAPSPNFSVQDLRQALLEKRGLKNSQRPLVPTSARRETSRPQSESICPEELAFFEAEMARRNSAAETIQLTSEETSFVLDVERGLAARQPARKKAKRFSEVQCLLLTNLGSAIQSSDYIGFVAILNNPDYCQDLESLPIEELIKLAGYAQRRLTSALGGSSEKMENARYIRDLMNVWQSKPVARR